MAKGQPRIKKVLEETITAQAIELPDLVGQSFASSGFSRNGTTSSAPSSKAILNNLAYMDSPFSTVNESYIVARDMIELCRKAYNRVPVFRTSIDIMTDLANTPIHLEGGNKQSQEFFKAWLKRINDFKLKDQIFRETFRSGNTFLWRVDAQMTTSEIFKLNNQNYAAKEVSIPTKYVVLDAASVCLQSIAYDAATYYKILNKFEVEQLKRSTDENDQKTYQTIKDAINAYARGAGRGEPMIELDPTKLHTIFYQKQDYEPFAVPMGYCVLDDINLSLELKKADAILARTVEYIILLVTMGTEPEKGGTNPKAMAALKELFKNEKIGRVLVSDYTTKAEFVLPDLEKILNPVKYEEVNRNIANGLMNIFFGEQKYADSITKLRALTKKIENVQKLFLNDFLNPEIKRISKQMNFKSYPVARMEPIRIQDQTEAQRVYAQLLQFGILSPEDGIELFETGLFPTYEELEQRQDNFKKQKDKGFFQPIQGGPQDSKDLAKLSGEQKLAQQKQQAANRPGGRPTGTKRKQSTKKVSQTGASLIPDEQLFSQRKVAETTLKLLAAKSHIEKEFKSLHGIKRLTKAHKDTLETVSNILFENEAPDQWEAKAKDYLTDLSQFSINLETQVELEDIKSEFEVDHESALILFHSKA